MGVRELVEATCRADDYLLPDKTGQCLGPMPSATKSFSRSIPGSSGDRAHEAAGRWWMAWTVTFPLTKKYIAEVLSQIVGLKSPSFAHYRPSRSLAEKCWATPSSPDLVFSQCTDETRNRGETLVAGSGYPVSVIRPSFSRCRLAWAKLTVFRTKSSRAIPAW